MKRYIISFVLGIAIWIPLITLADVGQFVPFLRSMVSTTTTMCLTGDGCRTTWPKETYVTVCASGCDYTTDGVADDVQIQAAVDYATSTQKGTVVLKGGGFNTLNTIVLRNDVELLGQGNASVIYPSSDIDVLDMRNGANRVSYLSVDTRHVAAYSSRAFRFDARATNYSPNYVALSHVTIKGNVNTSNGDKAIQLLDQTGDGITWVRGEDVTITGFNYGIYLESATSSGYVNGNSFTGIQCIFSHYCIYNKVTAGTVEANSYTLSLNGDATVQDLVYDEGSFNDYNSTIYDPNLDAGYAYNFASSSNNNYVRETRMSGYTYVNDQGSSNRVALINIGQVTGDVYFDNADIRMDVANNNWVGGSAQEGIRFDGSGTYGTQLNSNAGVAVIIDTGNNDTNRDFYVGHNNTDPDNATHLFDVLESGLVGVGTNTPFATLSVHTPAYATNTTLFAVASSTAGATTTLFAVSNTGSTTAANGFNITSGCYAIGGNCIATTSGTVTSVSASVPSFLSLSGSPITTSGTLALSYSGTPLPIANGGTATTAMQTNGVLYYNGSGVEADQNLIFDGLAAGTLTVGSGANNATVNVKGSAFNLSLTGGSSSGASLGVGGSSSQRTLAIGNSGTGGFVTSFARGSGQNLVGIGTTTPFAALSVHANPTDTAKSLFAIASSTSIATTSLFEITNTGLVKLGGPAPRVATSTGAGSVGTITLTGSPNAFSLALRTGTSPAGSYATIGTVTLPGACLTATHPIISPSSTSTAMLSGVTQVYASSTGVSTFALVSGSTALQANNDYKWEIDAGCN